MNFFVNKHNCDYKILIWNKTNPMPMYSKRYLDDIEYCLFFVEKGKQKFKGKDTYNNSFKCFTKSINVGDKDDYGHPTIKPIQCVLNHLEKTTSKNDIVLDPFMGSGTTAVACKELGRQYIGFEIDETYYKIATDRLNGINQKGQVDLFTSSVEQLDLFKD